MAKDPAVLFFISDWLTSTAEMDADCRGWYLNLILHNYDKKTLPNDLEKLAVLCGVKFSEFNRFEQVFEHVLKQKFEQVDENRLTNIKAQDILKAREDFKDKRSTAGKVSYVMKYFAKNFNKEYKNKGLCLFVKENFNYEIDLKDEQVFKHMFKHLFELYRNENENRDKDIIIDVVKDIKKSEEIYLKTILETDDEFLETVCNYFSQTTEVLKMRVHSFMSAQIKNGKFDEFKKQTLAYISYKNQSEEVKHRWQNYVTEWDKEDWVNKKAVNKRRETITTTADDNR